MIDWVLLQHRTVQERGFVSQFAIRPAHVAPAQGLQARLRQALQLYPCDIVVVHRDAEAQPLADRVNEIRRAAAQLQTPPLVCIVPVRMTEAWLLIDQDAIRRAADNPNARVDLDLPPLRRLETTPDPKAVLREALLVASEKAGRHLTKFRSQIPDRVRRVADLIASFEPLRALDAFRAFEGELLETLRAAFEAREFEP